MEPPPAIRRRPRFARLAPERCPTAPGSVGSGTGDHYEGDVSGFTGDTRIRPRCSGPVRVCSGYWYAAKVRYMRPTSEVDRPSTNVCVQSTRTSARSPSGGDTPGDRLFCGLPVG